MDGKAENNSKENLKNKKELNNQQNSASKELISLINTLKDFEDNLKSLKNINSILTKETFLFFKKLFLKENIIINLSLIRIYMNIINNKSLYNEYLVSITNKQSDNSKIEILLMLIENCVSLTEKLDGFVFSYLLFQFKKKIIDLVKCIYFNCKSNINIDENLETLEDYMENLPTKFFSYSFLEMNKSKELFDICKSQDSDKITNFEEKFSEINNYYEQFECFKRFVDNNCGARNCCSVNEDSIGKDENNIDRANKNNIEFYVHYGTLILKFCKYHKYMFLDKEGENEEKKQKENGLDNKSEKELTDTDNYENGIQNARVVFLLDRINQEKSNKDKEKEKKIENILNNKQYLSAVDSKEYKYLIKKVTKYYLNLTKNIEKESKIKDVREHLIYYLSNLDIDSYYPLYLKDFSKVSISDNFTPSYLTNVPAGKKNNFYFETKSNEETLVYIEFYLEDRTKDINFEINKYDLKSNLFKSIFKEEKIEDGFKFFIYCHGYSLYEMIFDNSYSWFNSKDINYRISLLTLYDKSKELNDEESFEENIYEEIKDVKSINIPVILYLNNLKIISFKKSEQKKEKENEEELVIKDHTEEDETIIPRHLFNYLLINHIKKFKVEKTKDIKYNFIISIFSMNKDLSSTNKELEEQIKSTKNSNDINYIKKIGFIPEKKIDDLIFEYKLYDIYEQILIYHMSLSIQQKEKISKTILIIQFDESKANACVYNDGKFFSKLKGEGDNIINTKDINIDNIDKIYNIIKNIYEGFEGVHLILTYKDNKNEEYKNKLKEIFGKIKNYNEENIIPPLSVFEYEENYICNKVIKYTNSFYENKKDSFN